MFIIIIIIILNTTGYFQFIYRHFSCSKKDKESFGQKLLLKSTDNFLLKNTFEEICCCIWWLPGTVHTPQSKSTDPFHYPEATVVVVVGAAVVVVVVVVVVVGLE